MHRTLIESLMILINSVRLEQGSVVSLVEENGTVKGVRYKNKAGEELTAFAALTIVCDGCFSNLRRSLCNPQVNMQFGIVLSYQKFYSQLIFPTLLQVEVPSCFVGLVLEKCSLPYENHGHVVLANPSPILMYPISSTEVRCLVDVPGQKVPSIANGEMENYLKTVVAPQV